MRGAVLQRKIEDDQGIDKLTLRPLINKQNETINDGGAASLLTFDLFYVAMIRVNGWTEIRCARMQRKSDRIHARMDRHRDESGLLLEYARSVIQEYYLDSEAHKYLEELVEALHRARTLEKDKQKQYFENKKFSESFLKLDQTEQVEILKLKISSFLWGKVPGTHSIGLFQGAEKETAV